MGRLSTIVEYVTEVPPDVKPKKDMRQDLLTDFIFALALFGIGFWFRFVVYDWFFQNFSDQFYITVSQSNWLTDLLGWQEGKTYPTEGYFDLRAYYYPYVENYVDGWNPYTGSRVQGDSIGGYVYGPFYIMLISWGTMFWGISSHDSVMISNLAFDALSGVMIYILAKRSTGNINAFIIASMYSFSPVVLYYFDIKLLNTPHMTFFTLVFIWCYLEHHDTSAIFFLTFGALIKQFPLIYAMPVLMLYVRRYGWIKAIRFFFLLIFFFLLLSFPYIVLTPDEYIAKFLVGGRAKTELLTLEEANDPARAGSTANLVFGSYFTPEDTVLDKIMFNLVNSHILFIVTLFTISWFAFSSYRILETRTVLYYRFFAVFQFLAHGTIARGIFKYYDAYLMSLLLLAFVPDRRPSSLNIRLGQVIKRAFHTVVSPKYRAKDVSWQYWLIVLLTVVSTFGLFYTTYWGLSLFLDQSNIRLFWTIIISFAFGMIVVKSSKDPYIEEDTSTVLSSDETRKEVTSMISRLSSKQVDDPTKESYPLFLFHLLSGIIAIGLIVYVFNSIYSIFFSSPDVLLGSMATIFFAVFLGIGASVSMVKDKWTNIELGVFVLSFMALRFRVFVSYLYSEYFIFGLPVETIVSTIVSLGYSLTLGYIALILRKLYRENLEMQTTFSTDYREFLTLQDKYNKKVKRYVDNIVLYIFMYPMLFVLDRAAVLFFQPAPEKYPRFVVSIIIILNSVWYLSRAVTWFRKEERNNLITFELYTFLLDTTFLLVGFWFFFKINWMILNIHRLLGPTLIFAVGIILLGMMGMEFWSSVYRFPKRILNTLWNSEKSGHTLPQKALPNKFESK